MSNKLEQADEGDRGAKIIQEGLGIDSDDVVQHYFPKTWPVIVSTAPASSTSGCRPRRLSGRLEDAGRT